MQGGVQEHALRSALRSKDVAASRWGWVVHSSEGAPRGEALKRATARLKRTWPRTILRSAVLVSFTQQKGSANAPSHAVIPASQRRIDQLSGARSSCEVSGWTAKRILYTLTVFLARPIQTCSQKSP